MRLWEDFGQKYCMFVASAFCTPEKEETFSWSSFHANDLSPGSHLQLPTVLQNQHWGGSCAVHGLYRPGHLHKIWGLTEDKVVFFFSSGCPWLSSWSCWCWSFVRHFAPCPPLKTLIFFKSIYLFFPQASQGICFSFHTLKRTAYRVPGLGKGRISFSGTTL